jgi:hypothetical protein
MKENWFRVHTSVLDSRKFERLSLAAQGLWMRLGALAKERDDRGRLSRRDGSPMDIQRIAREVGADFVEVERLLGELIEVGLIEIDDDGFYALHDWEEWQVTAEQREEWRERQRKHRNGLRAATQAEQPDPAECHASSQDVTRCHTMSRDVTPCHAMSRDVTESHLENKNKIESKNNSTAYADAQAHERANEIDHSQPVKVKKQRALRLQIQHPPPDKPPRKDYFHEVAEAFRQVVGDASDTLAVRACLSAWKQVREGSDGVPGLSANEITTLWKQARERASAEYRDRITLLWVLNNGEKARKLASYQPKPRPGASIDQTAEVVRLYFEAKAKREQEVQHVRTGGTA